MRSKNQQNKIQLYSEGRHLNPDYIELIKYYAVLIAVAILALFLDYTFLSSVGRVIIGIIIAILIFRLFRALLLKIRLNVENIVIFEDRFLGLPTTIPINMITDLDRQPRWLTDDSDLVITYKRNTRYRQVRVRELLYGTDPLKTLVRHVKALNSDVVIHRHYDRLLKQSSLDEAVFLDIHADAKVI